MARVAPFLFLSFTACAASAGPHADDAGAGAGGTEASCEASATRCAEFGNERPNRTSEHSAVFDSERSQMIVFGGTDSVSSMCELGGRTRYLYNTWIYDDPCGKWLRIKGVSPTASGRHMAALGGGSMWVFGGRFRDSTATSGPYEVYQDLARFDLAQRGWHAVAVEADMPPARTSGALIWDAKRKRLWLFGGNASRDGASYQPLDDLWSFDPKTARWRSEQAGGRVPSPRLFHAALYDDKRDAMIVYGGADANAFSPDAGYLGDLAALSLADLRWETLHPGGDGAPDARFWGALALEPNEGGGYLLFGGHDALSLGNRNDTWRFDPEAREWTQLAAGDSFQNPANAQCAFPPDFTDVAANTPERRSSHSLVFSPRCGRALLFGGKTDCGAIDDVWSFDGTNWQQRTAAREGEVCARALGDVAKCDALCTPKP